MDINKELEKSGIKIICPISTFNVNVIATYVARSLCTNFPHLKLNYNTVFSSVAKLNMFIAEMPMNESGASYFSKTSSLYFRRGLTFDNIKKLAVHECIHHFQEIKDSKGVIHRLGLCSYTSYKAYGNSLNEAAVQLMAAYANGEKIEEETFYGITLKTNSSSYYPVLCNLVKQLGYITDYPTLFDSTFYANDLFFNSFKDAVGEKEAFYIQQNFDKILELENKISSLNYKIQTEDLKFSTFSKLSNKVTKLKDKIRETYFDTQNAIVKGYFDNKIEEIKLTKDIDVYRKKLYGISALLGTADTYTFFNDYYIKKMAELDDIYARLTGDALPVLVKRSKISIFFDSIKGLFTAKEFDMEKVSNYYNS